MAINISLPDAGPNLRPKITVMGIGGAGGNAVNNMMRSNLEGVEFLVANTDAQALDNSPCEKKIQLGLQSTKGLGAGMRPDVGRKAAEEVIEEIKTKLEGTNMVFIAAGMGGGTGTGAAPVIAQLAREKGILTLGVVTKPFDFEGSQRMKLAEGGIEELQQQVDTLITIPNQNLFRVANEKTTFSDAFKMADDVLYAGVRGVTDLMVQPGLINLDFSDIKTVMSEMGKAMMGTGEAEGEGRAVAAAEAAIANPLIDDVSLKGAKGLIINITGGNDMTLYEVDEAANRIKQEVQEEANIIYGTTCDDRLEGVIRVSIVATGIDANVSFAYKPAEHTESLFIDNTVYRQKNTAQMNDFSMNKSSIEENLEEKNFENIDHHETSIHEKELNNNHNLSDLSYEDNKENNNTSSLSTENIENNFDVENTKISHSLESSDIELEKKNSDIESDNNDSSNIEIDNKKAVRKLSLFDNLEETSSETSETSSEHISNKTDPILNTEEDSVEEEDGSTDESFEDIESEKDNDSKEFEPEEDLTNEDFNQNQEEELLDIPTFLRRQAN